MSPNDPGLAAAATATMIVYAAAAADPHAGYVASILVALTMTMLT